MENTQVFLHYPWFLKRELDPITIIQRYLYTNISLYYRRQIFGDSVI